MYIFENGKLHIIGYCGKKILKNTGKLNGTWQCEFYYVSIVNISLKMNLNLSFNLLISYINKILINGRVLSICIPTYKFRYIYFLIQL